MLDLTHAGSSVLAAFLASLVEFVEALTIVLAVGTVRGWQPALLGTVAGAALLVLLVAFLGPLLSTIPIAWLQMAIGVLLLLFGMRWLRKAILRAAGAIPLHDEDVIYDEETALLRHAGKSVGIWDTIGVVTTFKAVVLEGLEVVFIVIALGAAGNTLLPAAFGAAAALLAVVVLGVTLHRPLTRVPENTLKFSVGVLLSAFGVFWVGEGMGFVWPGADLAILGLIAGFLVAGLGAVPLARRVANDTGAVAIE